jgi:hypothetical protein
MPKSVQSVRSIEPEYEGAVLGDVRLERRLVRVASQWSQNPEASIPQLAPNDAELEATYRLLGNTKVTWRKVLAPHVGATAARARASGTIRIAHDTTDLVFSGDREGLTEMMRQTKGFLVHTAFAVSGDEDAMPLGVLALKPYVRAVKRMGSLNEKKMKVRKIPRSEKESARWEELARTAQAALASDVEAIHVMDQEADDYVLLAELVKTQLRFVVRCSAARLLSRGGTSIGEAIQERRFRLFREIPVAARAKHRSERDRRSHPPRTAHKAALSVRATTIVLHCPQHAVSESPTLTLNVVQVLERNPLAGESPISWTLLTTEPVATQKDIAAVVDHYRARWKIEEFFKALKTGCSLQQRQLMTLHSLLNALTVMIPIAWRLLLLRTLARRDDEMPARVLFKPHQLAILRAISQRVVLPTKPSVRDVLLAIAGLGGHLRNNGEPGWVVLSRGFSDFMKAEFFAMAAKTSTF